MGWPIFKIHHQKSRYIYDLFYRRKAISRELYDFCIKEKIADGNLIAKWKNKAMKICAVCDVSRQGILISQQIAFVGYQKQNWKKEKLLNAFIVVVEVAQADYCSIIHA